MSEATTPDTEASVAPQRVKGASKAAASSKKASPKKGAPKATKAAKKEPKAKETSARTREGTKAAIVVDLLRRSSVSRRMSAAAGRGRSSRRSCRARPACSPPRPAGASP